MCLRLSISTAFLLLATSATAQISKLPHLPEAEDFFGSAVSLSGDRAAVGASGEDACGEHSGAVYVFEREPRTGVWSRSSRITCSECRPNHFFGQGLALAGNALVVASGTEYFAREHPNVAHVFERSEEGDWTEVAHLRPEQPAIGVFGTSVDVDGDRILVLSSGDRLRGQHSGAAYVFERSDDGMWTEAARILPARSSTARGDAFGGSGALRGDRMIVGAPSLTSRPAGAIYVFERDAVSGDWLQRARFDGFSSASLAVDISDSLALVGDHQRGGLRRGEARLFTRDASGGWSLNQRLVPSVSSQSGAFGTDVVLEDGRALVVGYDEQLDQAYNIDRVVFVFERDAAGGSWRQRHVIDIGETEFGAAIDADDGYAIIGSSGDAGPGAAYVVRVH